MPDRILNGLSSQEREKRWHGLFSNTEITTLIAEWRGQIIGFVSYCPNRDEDKNTRECGEIAAIYIHPDYWHQGFGTQLMNVTLQELRNAGYTEVTLWVLRNNNQARRFYEKMGFHLTEASKIVEYQDFELDEIRYTYSSLRGA